MAFARHMRPILVLGSGLDEMMGHRLRHISSTYGLSLVSLGAPRSFHGHSARMELIKPDLGDVLSSWRKDKSFIVQLPNKEHLVKSLSKEMFSSSTSPKKRESLIPALYISGAKLLSSPLKEIPMKLAAEKAMAFIENAGLKGKFMRL